jgi:putative ABC transport system permease protein
METLWQDLRYGARQLARSPGFTAVAVLTLALGIGANTAMFSVVHGVLLRPLPFQQPNRLVLVHLTSPAQGETRVPLSIADFLDWQSQNSAFGKMAAYSNAVLTLTGEPEAEQLTAAGVTAEFFSTLGASPLLGRAIQAGDDRPGSSRLVVLSQSLWERRFNSDPQIIGKTVTFGSRDLTVVGVMPSHFRFPQRTTEAWTNLILAPPPRRGPYFLRGIGRLKEGVSLEQAQAELATLKQLAVSTGEPLGLRGLLLHDYVVGDVRPAMLVLWGAVAFVLFIACANVANLLLSRAVARSREMAIRQALGAGWARLLRQILTESLLLAVAGGVLGLAAASWGVDWFRSLSPGGIPRVQEIRIDVPVLVFCAFAAVASAVLSALAPALRTLGGSLGQPLREGSRGASEGGAGAARLRSVLVSVEIALALILTLGASLMLNSFARLRQVDSGVRPEGVLTLQVTPVGPGYLQVPPLVAFYSQLQERLAALPGVESAALSISLPPDRLTVEEEFSLEGVGLAPGEAAPVAPMVMVSPGHFHTLGIPMLRGRDFSAADTAEAPRVAIINQTLAGRYFPGQDPLGKRIKQGAPERDSPWMEIVGVVGDVKYRGLREGPQPVFYEPLAQNPARPMFVVMRTSLDPLNLAPAVRAEIRALDPDVPASNVRTMEQLISESLSQPGFQATLLTLFSGTALLLAGIGVYGVMAFVVTQRIGEIGIRMALGAQPRDIFGLVFRRALAVVLAGLAVGTAGGLLLTRFLSGLLFGVGTTDPATFVATGGVLAAVALLASYLPARRAMRVDPMVALRYE